MNGEQAMNNEAKELIIFLDCGDTIIDEGTEVRDEHGTVIEGRVIPGADEMVRTLAERGYRLAIVADGLAQSFKNLLTINGLYDYFEVLIYSEQMKAEKPHPRMFKAAMGAMELGEQDRSRIIMVGNNLSRDVRGANRVGITSVHLNWTSRYPKTSLDPAEMPDYTIEQPLALVELADRLNEELAMKKRVQA
ncbi:putative hydrolase of the HAD superfamily [Paenibacillus catalpae]|uniref:Putative hydrolase of the HAD superfamily n=1 Tax=Paenibacillus catalpae TaxID=1045775 RepID=A0A1I1T3X1_9BACL|nr:HAD-IA family hydrolase [Paenibacillus catalpae]SFD50933.1 putative hydrolase of the HAD superfamily [Paenibacillus catalpae]